MDGIRNQHSRAAQGANLFVALLAQLFVGLPLLLWITSLASNFSVALCSIWAVCAFGLWVAGIVRIARHRADLGAVWGATFGSWLFGALGPIGAPLAVYAWRQPSEPPEEPVNAEVERRLNGFGRRLDELTRELAEIRLLAEGEPVAVAAPPPPPPPKPVPSYPAPPEPERKPSRWDREIDFGELIGAKGLAWAGGIVTVLGVVFFFVLAVNRGWIGPIERVGLGALASAFAFGAGLELRRRYQPTYSAYAAVGAGLAGGYATLVAAAALYGLVSDLQALPIAAVIAAVGLTTSLVWRSEMIAGIGLVGAVLIPMMVLFEEEISPLGTAFAGIVFAATAAVAGARRWPWLLGAGFLASLPQIAIVIEDGAVIDWDRVLLGGLFAALYASAATAFYWATDEEGLPALSATMVIVAGLVAGTTGAALFEGDDRGWAILVGAVAFGGPAMALFPRPADRDLSALFGALALALAAVGLALLLTGPSLAIAWAAEAAVLAWLAQRIDEPRYSLAALAYLGAAAVDAILEAPPSDLYEAVADPAAGALAPLAVGLGAAVVAFYSRPWREARVARGFFAYFEPLMSSFRGAHELCRRAAGWLSGIATVYAASLGTLAVAQWIDDAPVELAFQRGHVLVTGLWGLVALGLVVGSQRLSSLELRVGGLALAAATFVHAVSFDAVELTGDRRGLALLVAAAGLLAVAFADTFPIRWDEPPLWASLLAVASMGLAFFGVETLADSVRAEGVGWLGLAAVFGVLAALALRPARDFSAVLGALALIVAAIGSEAVLDGTWLVLAWSAAAVALAFLRVTVDEERLGIGSAGYLALALSYTLGVKARPEEFLTANADPAVGVPSLLLVTAAGLAFAHYAARGQAGVLRPYVWAAAAVLGIYAASLTILGGFQWLGLGAVETDFQRGHSAVSAFWGVIGLLALYVGLTRGLRALRLSGFGLFGLALAKLFLYDLAFLSSITRAASFLAVGAVLLLAGFFYQRLTDELREPARS